jgi:hypothetical protein
MIPDHEKLQQPANHTLPELFRALKWGRTASQQKFLVALASAIEEGKTDGTIQELLDGQARDNADWWKL